jgi:hypothetical protein
MVYTAETPHTVDHARINTLQQNRFVISNSLSAIKGLQDKTFNKLENKDELLSSKKEYQRAFRLDVYNDLVNEASLKEDIFSYLGEYRFKVREYAFHLDYDGQIRHPDGRPLLEIGENALADSRKGGGSLYKVEADFKGMQVQEELMKKAKKGDVLIYGSPPDDKARFTYGFVYVGEIDEINDAKTIHMRAIRVPDHTKLDQFNEALSVLTGETINYTTPNEFIEKPRLLTKQNDRKTIDTVLRTIFQYGNSQQDRQYLFRILQDPNLLHLIDSFIRKIKTNSSFQEKADIFNIIENYAEETWKAYVEGKVPVTNLRRGTLSIPVLSIAALKDKYGYTPTQVSGTCPNENDRTADIFGSRSIFRTATSSANLFQSPSFENANGFLCPSCQKNWVKGNACKCGMTQKKWAVETGIKCG